MQEIIFEKKVSKGSRFNQIYVPKSMENVIGVGDLVKVVLLKKQEEIYYKSQARLSEFKEYLAKKVFSILQKVGGIKAIFIVGSFLYETTYNDIDVSLIVDKEKENFENEIENLLTKKFNQRFHILLFSEQKLKTLIEKDPLTRAMFDSYISDKKFDFNHGRIIDKKHINFLLMMPEDLLEIDLSSKIFYDNIRRLITIEQFLKNEKLDRNIILNKIKNLIEGDLLDKIKDNQEINKEELDILRKIIKEKIYNINEMMNNGQKG